MKTPVEQIKTLAVTVVVAWCIGFALGKVMFYFMKMIGAI